MDGSTRLEGLVDDWLRALEAHDRAEIDRLSVEIKDLMARMEEQVGDAPATGPAIPAKVETK